MIHDTTRVLLSVISRKMDALRRRGLEWNPKEWQKLEDERLEAETAWDEAGRPDLQTE